MSSRNSILASWIATTFSGHLLDASNVLETAKVVLHRLEGAPRRVESLLVDGRELEAFRRLAAVEVNVALLDARVQLQRVAGNLLADARRRRLLPGDTLEDATVLESSQLRLVTPELTEPGGFLLRLGRRTILHGLGHVGEVKDDSDKHARRTRLGLRVELPCRLSLAVRCGAVALEINVFNLNVDVIHLMREIDLCDEGRLKLVSDIGVEQLQRDAGVVLQ
ncbi:hypothetical protein HYQ46_012797 [Verticillium longisporum]|nr:hypothetical protein HYQ46_012797 [Verticillium longisporum]